VNLSGFPIHRYTTGYATDEVWAYSARGDGLKNSRVPT